MNNLIQEEQICTNSNFYPGYPNSFIKAELPEQKKYVHNNFRLVIDSRDRDRSIYRNPNEFRVILPRRYRNISMIECGLIALPNFSNTEKYFLIQIKELEDGPYDSLDPHIAKSIALVPNRNALANYNYILETPGDTSFIKNYIKKFVDTPLASLQTLTLSIRKPDGSVVNFGNDLLPYDKEFSYTFTLLNIDDVKADQITLESPNNDLITNYDGESINIYSSTITYNEGTANGSLRKEGFPTLNGTYFSDSQNGTLTAETDTIVLTITGIKAFIENFRKNANNDIIKHNIKITGKWKRTKNELGHYSRIKIQTMAFPQNTDRIEITTEIPHNLKLHDRFYVDTENGSDTMTNWFKNFHVVTERISDTEFTIHRNNIVLDDITFNININGAEVETEENDTKIPDPVDPNSEFGFIQKYGDADPSIQSLFIFNITQRDEDDERVRSCNISYGNHLR